MSIKHRILILDASAFIAGFDPSAVKEETCSVPKVEDELLDSSMPKLRLNASIESGKLKIIEPLPQYLDIVRNVSKEVGDIGFLSEADMDILALATQLRDCGHEPTIITDDYSIQNIAEKLGLSFASLSNFGIRYHLHWLLYCPACGRKYPTDQKIKQCDVCGMQLKRKPLRKDQPTKEYRTTYK